MSHIASYRTQLYPLAELLYQAAVNVAARHEGGEVSTAYNDYYGHSQEAHLAIRTRTVFRGVGMIIEEDGSLTFKGDRWGHREAFEALQREIVVEYQALAVQQALQTLGYRVQETTADPTAGRVFTGVRT